MRASDDRRRTGCYAMYKWYENLKDGAKRALVGLRGRVKRTLGIAAAVGGSVYVMVAGLPNASASALTESTDTLFGFFPTIIELAITIMILGLFMGIISMVFKIGPFNGK